MKKYPQGNRTKEPADLADPFYEEHADGNCTVSSAPPLAASPKGLAERLCRIGAILHEAISLAWMDGLLHTASADRPLRFSKASFAESPLDDRVIELLGRIGSASPNEICVHLATQPSTLRRSLVRLTLRGAICSRGNTRALVYLLKDNRRAAA